MFPKIRSAAFIALTVWSVVSCFIIFRGSAGALSIQLADARNALANATRSNTELAGELQQLQIELGKSNQLVSDQQRIIAENKRQLDEQKRIIDGITQTIRDAGGGIGKQIDAIAEGFRRLYSFYHPSAGGSKAP